MPFRALRFPLLAVAMSILLVSIWAGLVRLGWPWSSIRVGLPVAHGPLMVSGFLGTLIGLERALAIGKRWAYAGPLATGLGAILLMLGVQESAGMAMILLGSLGMGLIFIKVLRRHFTLHTLTMVMGAFAWAVGNLLWLSGWAIYRLVMWWAGFLILTIAGERLELGRIVRLSPLSYRIFLGGVALFLSGLTTALFPAFYDPGMRLASGGMLALAVWLLIFDIARQTLSKPGLPRFTATCLLGGYLWLAGAGVFGLVYGGQAAGPRYDAHLHAIFLGFVFSAIFGHAPLIFPAILGGQAEYSPWLYLPFVSMQISLAVRVLGDLASLSGWRLWGGLFNGVSVLLFLGIAGFMVYRGRKSLQPGSGRPHLPVEASPGG